MNQQLFCNTDQMLTCKVIRISTDRSTEYCGKSEPHDIKIGTITLASAESYRISIIKYYFIPTTY